MSQPAPGKDKSLAKMTRAERRAAAKVRRAAKLRVEGDRAQEHLNQAIDAGQDVLNEVIDVAQDGMETSLDIAEALIRQIEGVLHKLPVGQLLLLAVKAAELTGDKSFLRDWRIINASA